MIFENVRFAVRTATLATVLCAFPVILPAQSAGLVTGVVTDAVSGRPLAGARVSAAGSSRAAVTNDRGEYRLEGIGAGDATLTASHLGNEPSTRIVRISAGELTAVDFALKPGSVLLSDVVVSANRSPQSPREVAATVNAMSRERVHTNPARTTDDLLRELPGIELPRTSSTVSGPEEIVSVRGADEGRTLVLLDDVPLNDPWGEWIQWNRAPRFQLDRAEILEGGGSNLYGNYAMGGVISLISQPILKRAYNLMASGGSRGAGDFSLYASNLAGPLGFSASADYGTGGGYTLLRPSQRGSIDQANSVTRRSLNGRVEYSVGAVGSLFANANYFDDDRSLGTPLTEPNRRRIIGGVLGGSFGAPLGGMIEARFFGQHQNYDSHSSVVNAARTSERPNVAQTIPSHDLGGSLQWMRSMGMLQLLSVGADFRTMVGSLHEAVYDAAGTVAGMRVSGGTQRVFGAFLQGVVAPVEPLRVEASARFDSWRSFNGFRNDGTAVPPTAITYPAKNNSAFAPRVGLRYKLLNSVTLRSSYYRAFRAPTLSEEYRTFFAGPNTFMGNPDLTPEYLTGYDIGMDWDPLPAVEFRATGFWNKYKDLDDFTFLSPGPTPGTTILQRQNVGAVRSRGGESEVAFRVLRELTLSASYNYDLARVVATKAFVNRVPLQRGSARLTFDSPRVATVNGIFRYEGPNHALGGARLAPFGVLDLDARRQLRHGTDVFAAAENLFNREYVVNRSGTLESLGLPRTLRAGISFGSF
ncbi:MAG: TonB-dependent receptor domain-containing protein [Gemmatimonadaceae bacterium]